MRRVRILHRSDSYGRELRVAEHIRKELTDIVRRKMRDPRISSRDISITEVLVAHDISIADVYVRHADLDESTEKQELLDVFVKAAGFLRTELAQRLAMRNTPKLRFHYDDLEEAGQQMDALIDKAIARETMSERTSIE
ncbi:MAG: 30S ribosome-binding factor RbfA [Gammaproteobacteria bacterium]|nr:30S ribosome-binding factor RbfA [Gammaproteobacteria bacterium]